MSTHNIGPYNLKGSAGAFP